MVYKLGKIIGRGSDGIVYELLSDSSDNKVIKFIQGESFGIRNYIEYYILNNLNENYVTKCHKVEIEEDGLIKIIFDKADSDLKDYITNNRLSEKRKKNIMKQLIVGLEYLHSFNIIHGDIKPSNVLVFGNKIKYSDFNLSKLSLREEKITRKLYTIIYRPPEILENKACFKSDIWALGCTFFEIYYGYGYFNYSKEKKFFHLKNSLETKEENSIFNDLIKNMICVNKNSRFTIDQIKSHPYFLEENFPDKFEKKNLLNTRKFKNILAENYPLFEINSKRDKKIFYLKC